MTVCNISILFILVLPIGIHGHTVVFYCIIYTNAVFELIRLVNIILCFSIIRCSFPESFLFFLHHIFTLIHLYINVAFTFFILIGFIFFLSVYIFFIFHLHLTVDGFLCRILPCQVFGHIICSKPDTSDHACSNRNRQAYRSRYRRNPQAKGYTRTHARDNIHISFILIVALGNLYSSIYLFCFLCILFLFLRKILPILILLF